MWACPSVKLALWQVWGKMTLGQNRRSGKRVLPSNVRTERGDSAIKGHAHFEKHLEDCDGYHAKGQDFRIGCGRIGGGSLRWCNTRTRYARFRVSGCGSSRCSDDAGRRHFHTCGACRARCGRSRCSCGSARVSGPSNDVESFARSDGFRSCGQAGRCARSWREARCDPSRRQEEGWRRRLRRWLLCRQEVTLELHAASWGRARAQMGAR